MSKKITSLDDVNADCLLIIIRDFKLFELNSLGETNKYLSSIVKEELRRRFATKKVYIAGMQKFADKLVETEKDIRIKGDSTAIQMIEDFGASIRNLKFGTNGFGDPEKIQKMFKLIEEHCSDNLNRLQLDYSTYGFFSRISRPFKNVETVKMIHNFKDLEDNRYTLSELFPALRRLELGSTFTVTNASKIVIRFPFLEHLGIRINSLYPQAELLAKKIIQKNPQIQSISLSAQYLQMIRFVQSELPLLKSLTIFDHYDEDDSMNEINFEHIESFTIKTPLYFPFNIKFNNNLRVFEVSVSEYDRSFLNVIKQNQNLQELKIIAIDGVSKNAMQDMILANLSVIKLTLIHDQEIESEIIIQLFESCKQLTLFDCSFVKKVGDNDKFIEEFKKRFENEWNINIFKKSDEFIRIFSTRK